MVTRSLLSPRLVDVVKQYPTIHRAARTLRTSVGRVVPPRQFPGIPGRIHFNDFMFTNRSDEEVASYRERALNVLGNIEAALAAAGRTFADVERWLDFGCGYGRVIRFLVERVPPERVFASDVVKEGVDFCRSEFGVHPIYSDRELANLRLGSFDFIYAISVLTHLNERNSLAMLRLLGESLRPGGIALFTVHGQYSLENLALYGAEYEARRGEITRHVSDRGLAFVPYAFLSGDDYGMAWHSRQYVERMVHELHGDRIRPLTFVPHGLDGHQDVFAFERVDQERRAASGVADDADRLNRQLGAVAPGDAVHGPKAGFRERKQDGLRQCTDDAARPVTVVHRVAMRRDGTKACGGELGDDLVEGHAADDVAGLLLPLCPADAAGGRRDGGGGGLADRHRAAGDARHLGQSERGPLEVMEAIVDVDDVDGPVAKWKGLGVGDDQRHLEAEPPRPLASLEENAYRDV
jgi:SAM-dependent methyltransferase